MKILRSWVLGIAVVLLACGRSQDSDPGVDAAPITVSAPPDNPSSAVKIELGRLLFWDPVLSGDRDVACASCHHPDFAYTDGARLSRGTGGQHAARNALTILDTAWNGVTLDDPQPAALDAPMFWDSRAHSLEAQAKGPISAPAEMRGSSFTATTIFPELVARLSAIPEYVTRFQAAFGTTGIEEENIVRAIATFERTLTDGGSSYDRYKRGDDSALSASQKRGLSTFVDTGCSGCHSGPMFSDYALHTLDGSGTFRTPSLRNVTRTAPYRHDGSLATLGQVFDFYDGLRGRGDPRLHDLRVPDGSDRNDVIALLQGLSDGAFDTSVPATVPSGLTVGGTHP